MFQQWLKRLRSGKVLPCVWAVVELASSSLRSREFRVHAIPECTISEVLFDSHIPGHGSNMVCVARYVDQLSPTVWVVRCEYEGASGSIGDVMSESGNKTKRESAVLVCLFWALQRAQRTFGRYRRPITNLVAIACVLTGLWWMYPPVAMVVAGIVLLQAAKSFHDTREMP